MSTQQLEILDIALSWEHWWSVGWIGPHVPPWTARTFPG
jgi:hypothetical protein